MKRVEHVGFDVTCGTCKTKYTVPAPGMTPDNLLMTGQKKVTRKIPYRCPTCQAKGWVELETSLRPKKH